MRNPAEFVAHAGILTKIVGLVRMAEFIYTSIIWLTQGRYTIVDNETYNWLSKYRWFYHPVGSYAYRTRSLPERALGLPTSIQMHREIMGSPQGLFIDHINQRSLDNRKANLRTCTKAENARNTGKKNGSGKYKGVYRMPTGKFSASICVNNKNISLGSFFEEELAARAYDEAARQHHKEFACTNQMLGLLL